MAVVCCMTLLGPGAAVAAEITLIGSPGVRAAITAVAPAFERASGHKLKLEFAEIALIRKRMEAGEDFDVVIPSPRVIDDMVARGRIAANTRAAFGRTGLHVAVPKGAAKPAIDSVYSFKRALRDAKAIGHSRYGETGINFLEVVKGLGMASELAPKLKTYERLIEGFEKGEVDLIVTGYGPILDNPLADLVGPLPAEIQRYVVFGIGVGATSRQPEAARAFLKFVASPESAAIFRGKGIVRD